MTQLYDFLIVGGGIAGASIAYQLAPHGKVILCEMESQPGYHTTGRSAAFFAETYGSAAIRPLTICSKAFLHNPPTGFSEAPLITPRGAIHIFGEHRADYARTVFEQLRADIPGVKMMSRQEVLARASIMKDADFVGGIFDPDCADLDVAAIHQGYLKGFKKRGGQIVCNAEILTAQREKDIWNVVTTMGQMKARIIVNSAGAWGDIIAERSGVKPIGLSPLRRTIVTIPFADIDADGPVIFDLDDEYYFKPESGQYLASAADETPSHACDVQPEMEDIANAVDKFERATNTKVAKIALSWAGLRTFAPDRGPVIGYDETVEGFFWNVGQGGYGIQTAPAWSRTAAQLIIDRALPEEILSFGVDEAVYSPKRFRGI